MAVVRCFSLIRDGAAVIIVVLVVRLKSIGKMSVRREASAWDSEKIYGAIPTAPVRSHLAENVGQPRWQERPERDTHFLKGIMRI